MDTVLLKDILMEIASFKYLLILSEMHKMNMYDDAEYKEILTAFYKGMNKEIATWQ